MSRPLLGPVALVCLLAACATEHLPVSPCGGALIEADAAALAVGDSLALRLTWDTSTACTVPEHVVWRSSDPAVARVDSLSGLVVATGPGNVDISLYSSGDAATLSTRRVSVFRPLFDRIVVTRFRISCRTLSCSVWGVTGPIGIWTLAADGTDGHLLRDSLGYPDHARVSPDGRTVLYEEWGSLYLMDGAGAAVRAIAPDADSLHYMEPSWSPDGRHIVYTGRDASSQTFQVFSMDPDGSHRRQLTHDALGAAEPAYSPDGATIAYTGAYVPPSGTAMVMDSGGAAAHALLVDGQPLHARHPEWSPDGSTLALVEGHFLTRLDVASGRYDTVAAYGGNRPVSWSPDGRRIIAAGPGIVEADPAQPSPYYDMRVFVPIGADSLGNMSPFFTPHAPGVPNAHRRRLPSN